MLLYIQTGKRPLRYLKGGHIMKKHKTMIWGLEMAFLVIAVSSCGNDGHIKQTESTMTVSVNENVDRGHRNSRYSLSTLIKSKMNCGRR